MPEHWRNLFEHLPFVAAVGQSGRIQVNSKDLVGAVLVGAISTVGSATLTTARLEERFDAMKADVIEARRQMADMSRIVSDMRERLARAEALSAPASDRRPR